MVMIRSYTIKDVDYHCVDSSTENPFFQNIAM